MAQRLELHALLKELLGTKDVYFQPPPTVQMVYPCIIYNLDQLNTEFANNRPYNHTKGYQVTVITKNPDSDIPFKVAELPMCLFNRFYTADTLNHYVYTLFF